MIRIVLADDHALLREGLTLLLKSQPDIEVVSEASNGVEALESVRKLHPDILLMDIAMPRMSGLETISLVKQASPETKIVILSMFEKEAYVHQVLKAGANGYVVKGAPSSDLLDAIRKVNKGKYYLSSEVQASVIDSYIGQTREVSKAMENFNQLTEREKEVFHLLVQGNSSAQIGDILCISPKTVDKHRSNIARKIGTENPVQMVQYAVRAGLLDPSFWGD